VKVLPVDVNASRWHATLEVRSKADSGRPEAGSQPAIRLGLEQVHGLGEAAGARIEAARADGRFRLLRDLARRAGLGRESLLHLARAGGLASLGLDRRRAVWEALRCLDRPGSMPLLEGLAEDGDEAIDHDAADDGDLLPALTMQEEVIADYRTTGLSLMAHPLQFERERCAAQGIVTIAEATAAPEGRRVQVAGIVLTRQRPATAKGMIFLTIEDETAAANIVVRPDVWDGADHHVRRSAILVVQGRIQRRGSIVHVVATRLACDSHPAAIPRMSRDFC
jgi:error-prone DNA polymerase